MLPKPLAFSPNGSLKLTPSIEKSLNLLFWPITEISAFLDDAEFIDTLGSNFAKSAIDLLIVGTPSIACLSRKVPVPILILETPLEAVTTTSSRSAPLESRSTFKFVMSLSINMIPSIDSDL